MTTDEKTKRAGAATTAKQSNESAAARAAMAKPSTQAPKSQSAVPRATIAAQSAATRPVVIEGMTPGKKLTYEERMRRLAPIVRVRRKIESTVKRFANVAEEVRRWKNAPALREAATTVETALAGLLAEATTTTDAFQPERERKACAHQLQPGTKVTFRDKFVPRYEGVLEASERTSLEVVATARGQVSVKTATRARLVLPRGHLAKVVDTVLS